MLLEIAGTALLMAKSSSALAVAKIVVDKCADHAVDSVVRKLFQGVAYNPAFSWLGWPELMRLQNSLGQVDVAELRAATDEKPWLSGNVVCTGLFMAGSLLNKGWWERSDRTVAAPAWGDIRGVQSWLYNGFYQWAPSWDVNGWNDAEDSPLLGQIGRIDEADSIPVVVTDRAKARAIREELTALAQREGRLVSRATVRGKLCSLKYLEKHGGEAKALIGSLKESDALRQNCILVGERPGEGVDLDVRAECEPYSGYMWKCICPDEHKDKPNRLLYSYFVWEHTNFADKDAINYNLDALNHKIEYIAKRRSGAGQVGQGGGVTLLQQMTPEDRLRGEPGAGYQKPEITVEDFRELFARESGQGKEQAKGMWPW